jgi:cytochrome c oxidase cbb3-type subunit 2
LNLRAMQRLGVPYTDAEVAASAEAVKGKTEMDALAMPWPL